MRGLTERKSSSVNRSSRDDLPTMPPGIKEGDGWRSGSRCEVAFSRAITGNDAETRWAPSSFVFDVARSPASDSRQAPGVAQPPSPQTPSRVC